MGNELFSWHLGPSAAELDTLVSAKVTALVAAHGFSAKGKGKAKGHLGVAAGGVHKVSKGNRGKGRNPLSPLGVVPGPRPATSAVGHAHSAHPGIVVNDPKHFAKDCPLCQFAPGLVEPD